MTKSCLVVDDSAIVRRIARRLLQHLGFQVLEAENGQVASEMCASSMPDAVLLDWNMPVVNGIDFLRLLRKMKNGSAPKVIFCTTESDVQHISEAFEAGADEYLMKPFDANMLRAKLLGSSAA